MVSPDSAPRATDALQPQDLVLTMLGAHLRRPGETVWSGGMVRLLGSFGFTTGSARAALSRLVLRDLLRRTREARFVHYALSGRAEQLLADGDRRIFSFGRNGPTPELWTIVWHTIPEDQRVARSRLVSRLRFLGFGSLQDATWVAASDREQEVLRVLAALGMAEYASVFVGRPSRETELGALIAQAWRLDDVAARYRDFLAVYGPLERRAGQRTLDDQRAFIARTSMLHRFRGFPFLDPELPPELDPVLELRGKVVATFDAVYRGLEPAAERHFSDVTRSRPAVGCDQQPGVRRRE
jgi:phenylacetic acid degradation operon negative regulatory protein